MLSERVKEEILGAVRKYHTKKSAVMDALRIAQAAGEGTVSTEDMEEIAELLGIEPVEVHAAGTFYTMYNINRAVGRHHIWVCRNLSCSLMGAEHLIGYLEKVLDIKVGETTPDNRFTLDTAECLGSCGTAPMMQIDDEYYEDLTEEKIDEILEGLD